MSDQFYLNLLPKINATVQRFGTAYKVRGPGAYDEQTMVTAPATARDVTGLVSDGEMFNGLGGATQNPNRDASNISWSGKKVLILTAQAQPTQGEEVQVDGRWFPLSRIKEIKPANVVLLYLLDVTV